MLVADLDGMLERLAPKGLADQGDNCGLLVGSKQAAVNRLLVALELTHPVLDEAIGGGYDTVLTHHPFLFSPFRKLVDSSPRERLLRRLVGAEINLYACHTNLDAAAGGLADVVAASLGLQGMRPLRHAAAWWYKLVGFLPPEAADDITAAVFAAGAGTIGNYEECAFAVEGRGWFTPGIAAHPTIGEQAVPQRTAEIRWETVVPRSRLAPVIAAYVNAHPYEEPAFDVYPVEDVFLRAGAGRVGALADSITVSQLARRVSRVFGFGACRYTGDGDRRVRKVAVVPGSGRSFIEDAAEVCDAFVTGDLGYHDAERATELGLALVEAPHGELEWWALCRWTEGPLREALTESGVTVSISQDYRSPWAGSTGADQASQASGIGDRETGVASATVTDGATDSAASEPSTVDWTAPQSANVMRIHVDGGSRGNPGPSAIGVVLEDAAGHILEALGEIIGVTTNNVAEYRALLRGLELAKNYKARDIEVFSDSELLVRQMSGEYRVKNEGLRSLYEEAMALVHAFDRVVISHVSREDNARADELVNQALDSASSI